MVLLPRAAIGSRDDPGRWTRQQAARDTAGMSVGAARVRLSRVIGAMSYALDVTEGEPPGHAVRACKIGMRLAQVVELDAATCSRLFYALLLKDAGCSANSAKMAALFGADDHVAKRTSKRVDWSGRLPAFVWALRTVAPGGSVRGRLDRLLAIKAEGDVNKLYVISDGVARERIVQLGLLEDNMIQVKTGVNENEVVAISNVNALIDGIQVRQMN